MADSVSPPLSDFLRDAPVMHLYGYRSPPPGETLFELDGLRVCAVDGRDSQSTGLGWSRGFPIDVHLIRQVDLERAATPPTDEYAVAEARHTLRLVEWNGETWLAEVSYHGPGNIHTVLEGRRVDYSP